MSLSIFYILHVASVLALTGFTFYAFAAPAETRKRVMMLSGISSLLVLVAGFGLLGKLHLGFPGWVIVKLVCWFALSGLAGVGYRRRGSIGTLMLIALALVIIALVMVYTKPF